MRRSTMPEFQRILRFNRVAARTHFDGFCDAGEPRKALACPPAGIRRALLRPANYCGGKINAIVAGHRQFQPPPKAVP